MSILFVCHIKKGHKVGQSKTVTKKLFVSTDIMYITPMLWCMISHGDTGTQIS